LNSNVLLALTEMYLIILPTLSTLFGSVISA